LTSRLSNIVAATYLVRFPSAVAVKYRTGRTHLVEEGRPECGALLTSDGELLPLYESMPEVRWCYSCLGNAIERMETE
jgi:hypothetical protein